MSTSRRKFLKSGAMVALAAGIPGGISRAVQVTARDLATTSNFVLSKAAFEANLNSRFLIRVAGSQAFELKLAEVADLKRYRNGKVSRASGEGFSLLFEGPKGIPQDRYQFHHEKMGKFDLLMVPIQSRKKKGRAYEVVINRLFT